MSDQVSTTLNSKSHVIQRELKIKKARDRTGWKTDCLREGRDETVKKSGKHI